MNSKVRIALSAVTVLVLGSSSDGFARGVLVVSAGGAATYPNPQSAINAAVDGDTILIKPGTYPGFVVSGKSLDIVGDGSGVKISAGFSVRNLSAVQKVMLRGIEAIGASKEDAIQLKNNVGSIYLEGIRSQGTNGFNTVASPLFHPDGTHAVTVIHSNVVMVRCQLYGGLGSNLVDEVSAYYTGSGGSGVWCESSTLAVLECIAIGGKGGSDDESSASGGDGGHGVYALDTTVIAIGSELRGSDGGSGGEEFSHCGNGGDGGAGIYAASASTRIFYSACELSSGIGGHGGVGMWGIPTCANGSSPRAIDHAQSIAAEKPYDLGVGIKETSMASPLRAEDPTSLLIRGNAGDVVLLRMSEGFQSSLSIPLAGVLVNAQATVSLFIPPLPPSGVTQLPMVAPVIPVGEISRRFVIQGVFTQLDRKVVLSAPTIVTILDPSL